MIRHALRRLSLWFAYPRTRGGGYQSTALGRMIAGILLLLATPVCAGGQMIVVVGAEGEPEFGRQFNAWADRWVAAATGVLDVEQIGRMAAAIRPAATGPATTALTQPASDKDALHAALQAAASEANDPLWLVLIGHGTADGGGAKFNLRGPDLSDAELADWLRPIRRPVAVIDCSSSSGPFLKKLAAPGRVVVVATRGGSEHQFARFGDAMSLSITDPAADLDKDGQTSLLEAFLVASGRVEAFYKSAGRLTTEHALLDDTGRGSGVGADAFDGVRPKRPNAVMAADGARAQQWYLRPTAGTRLLSSVALARRGTLEAAVETLRAKKATMSENAYFGDLERLMIELAKLSD